MIKTKKKFLLMAILTIVAMLCCGLSLILLANVNNSTSTSVDMTVKADSVSGLISRNLNYNEWEDTDNHIVYLIVNQFDKYVSVDEMNNFTDADHALVEGYTSGISGAVTIKSSITVNGVNYKVTKFGYGALGGATAVTSVTIEDGIMHIADRSFEGCVNLQDITIPESVSNICVDAFKDCSMLGLFDIPGNLYDWSGLKSLNEATFMTTSGGMKFVGTKTNYNFALIDVTDKSQSSYSIPNSTKYVDITPFSECSNPITLAFPNGIISISGSLGSNLTELDIPNNIYYCDFTNLNNWGRVATNAISSNLLTEETDNDTTVYYLKTKNNPHFMLIGCSNGDDCSCSHGIDSDTKFIGRYAFERHYNLETITLPESLTGIGYCAFLGTSLSEVTIPSSVKWIDGFAFAEERYQGFCLNSFIIESENCELIGALYGADGLFSCWGSEGQESGYWMLTDRSILIKCSEGYNNYNNATGRYAGWREYNGVLKLDVDLNDSVWTFGDEFDDELFEDEVGFWFNEFSEGYFISNGMKFNSICFYGIFDYNESEDTWYYIGGYITYVYYDRDLDYRCEILVYTTETGWLDENLKTITIKNLELDDEELSKLDEYGKEDYEWLIDELKGVLVDDAEFQDYAEEAEASEPSAPESFDELVGSIWTFEYAPAFLDYDVEFSSNGLDFVEICFEDGCGYYYTEDAGAVLVYDAFDGGWKDEAYKTITFADDASAGWYDEDSDEWVDNIEYLIADLSFYASFGGYVGDTPETGIALDIIVPTALIVMALIATIYVARKKEYNK